MSQYYEINSKPELSKGIHSQSIPYWNTTVIINNNLLFVDCLNNMLTVMSIDPIKQKQNNYEDEEDRYILIKGIKLQNVTYLINTKHNGENILLLLTTTHIHYLQLNDQLTQAKLQCSYCLVDSMFQPTISTNKPAKSLLNQQWTRLTNSNNKTQSLMVAGYNTKTRVAVNHYQLVEKKETSHKLIMVGSCFFDIETQKIPCFTLTSSAQSRLVINVFPWFRQKGELLTVHQYNLQSLLYISEPTNFVLKHQPLVHKIGLLQSYYLVKAVHQQGDDLYICYTGYVKFQKDKNSADCQINSHIWVYNISQGYNRNIIDLDGSMLHISTNCDSEQTRTDKFLEIILQDARAQKFTIKTIKMNSLMYHPHFECLISYHPILISKKCVITISSETNNNKQSQYRLQVYNKIDKKSIYCKMWQLSGSIGGEPVLECMLNMLTSPHQSL